MIPGPMNTGTHATLPPQLSTIRARPAVDACDGYEIFVMIEPLVSTYAIKLLPIPIAVLNDVVTDTVPAEFAKTKLHAV